MNRPLIFFIIALLLGGCAYGKEKARKIIIDADYAHYEEIETELEKAYINGEITYVEYQNKLEELRQDRIKSAKEREQMLSE